MLGLVPHGQGERISSATVGLRWRHGATPWVIDSIAKAFDRISPRTDEGHRWIAMLKLRGEKDRDGYA